MIQDNMKLNIYQLTMKRKIDSLGYFKEEQRYIVAANLDGALVATQSTLALHSGATFSDLKLFAEDCALELP